MGRDESTRHNHQKSEAIAYLISAIWRGNYIREKVKIEGRHGMGGLHTSVQSRGGMGTKRSGLKEHLKAGFDRADLNIVFVAVIHVLQRQVHSVRY